MKVVGLNLKCPQRLFATDSWLTTRAALSLCHQTGIRMDKCGFALKCVESSNYRVKFCTLYLLICYLLVFGTLNALLKSLKVQFLCRQD